MAALKQLDFLHIEPKFILKMIVQSVTKDSRQIHKVK